MGVPLSHPRLSGAGVELCSSCTQSPVCKQTLEQALLASQQMAPELPALEVPRGGATGSSDRGSGSMLLEGQHESAAPRCAYCLCSSSIHLLIQQ